MVKLSPTSHFRLLVGAALLVLAMGNAFTLRAIQDNAHSRCVETAKRAAATAPTLEKVVAASRADGDTHMAAFWQTYLDVSKKNPVPKC